MEKFLLFTTVVILHIASTAQAAVYSTTGKLDIVRTHDSVLFPTNDWVSVEGFTTAGNCGVYNNQVVMRINESGADYGDRMFGNVLLAKGTNATVSASVDDTHADSNGYCYIRHFNIID